MAESSFQNKVANHLKRKGCEVYIMTVVPGIPTGTPDIVALVPGGGWLTFETKKENPYRRDGVAKKGAFRPLQQEKIKRLNEMYYSRPVWPEIWGEVKDEIDNII